MAATLKLQSSVIHCTKTGLALFPATNANIAIEKLNELLESGVLEAGRHPAKVFLSENKRGELGVTKTFGWCRRQRDGSWKQYDGWTVGQHNQAIFDSLGIVASIGTLGVKSCAGRRYCKAGSENDPASKKAKPVTTKVVTQNSPLFGGKAPKEPTQEQEAKPAETVFATTPQEVPEGNPWPVGEWNKRGAGHSKYVARMAKDYDLNKQQAQALWAHYRSHKQARKPLSLPSIVLKAEGWESRTYSALIGTQLHNTEVATTPAQEAPKEPMQRPTGQTVRCKPELLTQLLESLPGNPRVTGFDNGEIVVAL